MKFGYTIMEEQKLNTETDLVKKEIKPEEYLKDREDLSVQYTLLLEETCGPGEYVELTELDAHEQEFSNLVKEAQQKFANETKLLEGAPIPTYESILKKENQQK
jgi:hypothetical protein